MELIGMLDSPYVRRVAVSLQLLGLEFSHRIAGLRPARDLRVGVSDPRGSPSGRAVQLLGDTWRLPRRPPPEQRRSCTAKCAIFDVKCAHCAQ